MPDAASAQVQEFRYKITFFVDGVLTLDARVLRFHQGVRRVQVPYANVRAFGARARGKSLGGVVTSELVLRTEPAPGTVKIVRLPLDPTSAKGKDALAALRARLPAAEDTTPLPWPDAAARLGVPAYGLTDAVANRWGTIGAALVAGAGGMALVQAIAGASQPVSPSERLGRGIVQLAAIVIGVALVVVGYVRSKKQASR